MLDASRTAWSMCCAYKMPKIKATAAARTTPATVADTIQATRTRAIGSRSIVMRRSDARA
jgi:hypothetical protein